MTLRVKEIAKQKGLQLKEVAEKMKITPESLTRAISGNPQLNTLISIAEALQVDIAELFPQPNQSQVNGYLEFNGEVWKIKNNDDLYKLVEQIKSME